MLGAFEQWRHICGLRKERMNLARRDRSDEKAVHDPIEDDPRYREILQAADIETEQVLANISRGMGFCHRFWRTKQTILLKNYGVVWFSPADLNPGFRFD